MSNDVVNMTADFKLINQDQRCYGPDQLHWINNVAVLLLAWWKCNFTSFKVVGPLKILKTDSSQVITTQWLSNVRHKTQRKDWDCFGCRLISVLKASIAIIQRLQNNTLSKDNFFSRAHTMKPKKVSKIKSQTWHCKIKKNVWLCQLLSQPASSLLTHK